MTNTTRFNWTGLLRSGAAVLLVAWSVQVCRAATLASATFDTDSYIFVGTNNEFQNGISTFTDY